MKRIWRLVLFIFSSLTLVCNSELYAATFRDLKTTQAEETSHQEAKEPILSQIQLLRARGENDAAKNLSLAHLAKYPDDVDVILLLGLIYKAQKNYAQAEICLKKVLQKTPLYLDARIGLIGVKIEKAQYSEALELVSAGLKVHPDNEQLLTLKNNIKNKEKQNTTDSLSTKSPIVINKTAFSKASIPADTEHFAQIQLLRKKNKMKEAKQLALSHLKNHPDDIDVQLLLGLIYRQQQNYVKANITLIKVLQKNASYLDALIGLINVKKDTKQYQEALNLIKEGLKLHPHNKALLELKKNTLQEISLLKKSPSSIKSTRPPRTSLSNFTPQQNYNKRKEYMIRLQNYPNDTDVRVKLADAYLFVHQDMGALLLINQGLKREPHNIRLLIKKGQIQRVLYRYALAADPYKKVLYQDPQNKEAQGLLNEINAISPYFTNGVNEIGINTDNAYVSDLHTIWDYSNLYYSRDTDYGILRTQLNYASRQHRQAPQFELAFSPRLNRHIYFDFMGAYANQPVLFPKVALGGEGHLDNPKFLNMSFGAKYAKIGSTYFTTYTASLDRYIGNYWISFRPYYFVPKDDNTSLLYTGVIRRYFDTIDNFLGLTLGSGHSPDLADLLTVNFLVIKNDFVNLNYQVPVFNHQLLVNLGVGYQRWKYPSQLLRNLYNTSIGVKHRF